MIIGIDLGTTNSLTAYFTPEGAKLIPNRLGKNLTPSVVSIDEEGQIYVGETAQERMRLYPLTAASVFKRSMGSDKEFTLSGKTYRAEELSSFVLRSLKEDAEAYLGEEVTEAVISVPAYFNDARRRATKKAGELAGLKVERIISEPTAAAIAYGLYQENKNTRFLVFDLGGGTFDVSILELFENILEVRAVAGDNFLGGEDFTDALIKLFCEAQGLNPMEMDLKSLESLYHRAEECKKEFTQSNVCTLSFRYGDTVYEQTISAPEYEAACGDLLERIRQPIKRSLNDAGVRLSQIDKVVLVGGATKMPMIRHFVAKLFRRLPDASVNPDEAVALGAAIQAAMKERNEAIREVILTDVCPFTLGTEVVREVEEGRYEGGHYCPIIERNTVIPASRTERMYTIRDNQTRITVQILQGESRFARNNLCLGRLEIDIPKAKAGEEPVDVTYTYDINSILEVEVKVVSTGKTVRQVIKSQYTQMSDEEIEQRLKDLSYLKIHPRDQEENKLLLLKGERLYEENIGNKRLLIEQELNLFEKALDSQEAAQIAQARSRLQSFLERIDKQ
ncbi:MAG: molecular chaperone HscC [Lachnospiraceae bacterium]|jgi:molecular chaperone HscC|nr:molecular chaperone HscC [Lachnospiraceae bacterium]